MERVKLKNRYWIVRHGRSIPNEKGIIVASMGNGVLPDYGLSSTGKLQAADAGKSFLKEVGEAKLAVGRTHIYASPFSRARETAQIVAGVLDPLCGSVQVQVVSELRERYFGPTFELQSHNMYSEIWKQDVNNPFMGPEGGESVADVGRRMCQVVVKLEESVEGCAILLVSHGDPLQILQALLHGALLHNSDDSPLSTLSANLEKQLANASILRGHRSFEMNTGELRQVA